MHRRDQRAEERINELNTRAEATPKGRAATPKTVEDVDPLATGSYKAVAVASHETWLEFLHCNNLFV